MRRPPALRRAIALAATACLTLAACGGDDADETATSDQATTPPPEEAGDAQPGADGRSTENAGDPPDACSLFDVREVSTAVGREVGPGEPEPTPEGGSSCRFETLPGLSTSTSYDDPVVPGTAFGSVTISTAGTDADEFDEFEGMLGAEAEAVEGIGDDAYLWGENIIYVRVADRGLTVRIEADEADSAAVRDAVLALAELGASKLGNPNP